MLAQFERKLLMLGLLGKIVSPSLPGPQTQTEIRAGAGDGGRKFLLNLEKWTSGATTNISICPLSLRLFSLCTKVKFHLEL